jgi:hypothetical protein
MLPGNELALMRMPCMVRLSAECRNAEPSHDCFDEFNRTHRSSILRSALLYGGLVFAGLIVATGVDLSAAAFANTTLALLATGHVLRTAQLRNSPFELNRVQVVVAMGVAMAGLWLVASVYHS